MKTTDEISNEIVDKEKHILVVQENLNLLQEEQYKAKMKLFELSESVRKEKSILGRLRTEHEILEMSYWKSKQ